MTSLLDLDPLSVAEAAQVATLLTVASPGAPDDRLYAAIAAIINRQRGPGQQQVTPRELQALVQERLQGRFPQHDLRNLAAGAAEGSQKQLAEEGVLVAAVPPVAHCCHCQSGSLLQLKLLHSKAWFYSEKLGPQVGPHYKKRCTACGTDHFLDGYEPPAAAAGAPRPRRMYPTSQLEHPTWQPFSSETLVACPLLERHLWGLHHSAVSFDAATKVYNRLFTAGAHGGVGWGGGGWGGWGVACRPGQARGERRGRMVACRLCFFSVLARCNDECTAPRGFRGSGPCCVLLELLGPCTSPPLPPLAARAACRVPLLGGSGWRRPACSPLRARHAQRGEHHHCFLPLRLPPRGALLLRRLPARHQSE